MCVDNLIAHTQAQVPPFSFSVADKMTVIVFLAYRNSNPKILLQTRKKNALISLREVHWTL